MKPILGADNPNSGGQSTLQVIFPLLLLFSAIVGFALAIPVLSLTKTLALVGGMIVFIVTFASTEIALYILIFSMLLSPEFMVGTTEGASMGRGITLRVDDFLLVVIGFSWLAKMAVNKDLGLFLKTPLNRPIAFYILVCLVSTLLGIFFGRVQLKTGFFYVLKYFEYMIVYFMAVNHLSRKTQVRNYLGAMLVTCAVVCLIATKGIGGAERISAPFEGEQGEPNTFGGYLVFMGCLATGLLLNSRSFRNKLICCGLILLFALLLFYTQSRTSYVAAAAALITFPWFYEKKHWVVPGVLMLGLVLPFIAPYAARERVKYTFTQGKNRKDVVEIGGVKLDTSTSARLISWKQASEDWGKHPVLGYGVTGYHFVDAQYFRVIIETGMLGLFSFFFLVYVIFREARKSLRSTEDPLTKGLCTGYLAGFVGLVIHALGANTFIIVRIMEPFWFVTAMVIMTPRIEKGEDKKEGLR